MAADNGRMWALETFGADGVQIRELVPEIIQECHEKLANAQLEADMVHQGVYGQVWRRCLVEFSRQLGQLPTAERIAVPRAGYSLVRFGNVVIFPWRYSREPGVEIGSKKFAVSDARVSIFHTAGGPGLEQLPLDFPHPELTPEELELIDAQQKALREAMTTYARIVVVAYASSQHGLHNMMWGEATLDSEGFLTFATSESLIAPVAGALASVDVTESFAEGPVPTAVLGVKEEQGTDG